MQMLMWGGATTAMGAPKKYLHGHQLTHQRSLTSMFDLFVKVAYASDTPWGL